MADLTSEWETAKPIEDEWDKAVPIGTKQPSTWKDRAKLVGNILTDPAGTLMENWQEPARLGAEILTAPVSALKKAYQGYAQGIPATIRSFAKDRNLDKALLAGSEAIGQRGVTSPLEPSQLSAEIGGLINPMIKKISDFTGQPELVEGTAEALGDISSIYGIKPGVKSIGNFSKQIAKSAPDSGIAFLNPERLYGSAAKMPLSKAWTRQLGPEGTTKRTEAIRAGIEGEVPINEFGVTKAKKLEKDFRTQVDSAIEKLDNGGYVIRKDILKPGLEEAFGVAGTEGTTAASRIVDSLYDKRFNKMGELRKVGEKETIGTMGEKIITDDMQRVYKPSEMQTLKRHLYKMENYEKQQLSRGLASQIKELGNKGMAEQAKLALEELYPELKNMNKQDAAYINLVDALERAVPRISNKDMIGLGTKALAAGSHPGLSILEHTLGHPRIKTSLAFALNRARRLQPKPVAGDISTAMGLTIPSSSIDNDPLNLRGGQNAAD